MKKITLLAAACALFAAPAMTAQETQYVEDANQGYVMNSFKDNWFITLQGGVNVNFSKYDVARELSDRFAPNASLYIGKWFTPVFGGRIGADWLYLKGNGPEGAPGYLNDEHRTDGYYKTRQMAVGPTFDLMVNLTNLFCGYKPGRWYNLTVYGGGGAYYIVNRTNKSNGEHGWHTSDGVLTFRGGIINSFNVSKQVQLSLDLRASAYDAPIESADNRTNFDLQAYLGVTYLFNNSEWHHPVVPVCPPVQNCDAVVARLNTADTRINELENSLRECMNRPAEVTTVEAEGPLATIYYPINVYRLTREDNNVLTAIANVMKANPNTKYVLTGWADNCTGTPEYNETLRHNRVNGVYDKLIKLGVPESQLTATVNNGSLSNLEPADQFVSLDRAVTITEAK